MGKYIVKRVLLMLFVLLVITLICFVLVRMLPPAELPLNDPHTKVIEMRREAAGYNKPYLVQFWIFHITRQGLRMAAFMGIRLVLLIIGSTMLTLTTRPISLTDGIESLLSPFKNIGMPAHELAMMMSIALRFIPTLLEETDKIIKAQQARGADFESGNILRRAKALVPILVPLFISAFRIAQDLAMAMESRCYGSGIKRTRMNAMKLGKNDLAASLLFIAFLAIIVLERILLQRFF